ncbi:hypothetical protein K1719_010826 [Acacia pycnantha]|nr:hypothetical protein K1719_010826 [Acacia pycnantha]
MHQTKTAFLLRKDRQIAKDDAALNVTAPPLLSPDITAPAVLDTLEDKVTSNSREEVIDSYESIHFCKSRSSRQGGLFPYFEWIEKRRERKQTDAKSRICKRD